MGNVGLNNIYHCHIVSDRFWSFRRFYILFIFYLMTVAGARFVYSENFFRAQKVK